MRGFRIEKFRGRNGTCRISLSGRFGDSAALELEDRLNELLNGGSGEAMVDMGEVSALSRENLGVLLGMSHSFRASGGRLSLRNLPPRTEADMRLLTGDNYFQEVVR